MTKVDNISAKRIPFQVTDPERIPVQRYYDEEFYRLENERVWPNTWQMACRLEQIPNIGDWTEYSNLGKSVIVVRTPSGVKAFHNACRHRGVELATGHGNCRAQGFICPFHGWRYNMNGQNTFVYGRSKFDERQLDQADISLAPCRVELWGGCAFINHSNDAPGFRESLGVLAERLEAYNIDKLRAEWWKGAVVQANWKTAMEAFMESMHVMKTHPAYVEAAPQVMQSIFGPSGGSAPPVNMRATVQDNIRSHIRSMELLSEGMGGMCHPKDVAVAQSMADIDLPSDPVEAVVKWYTLVTDEVTKQGRARGEPTPDLNKLIITHPLSGVEYLFPHFFMLPFLSSFSSYRVRPLGPETCFFEIWSLTLFPEGQEPTVPLECTIIEPHEFPQIPREDFGNIPRQQRGLHAGGFEFMRLSKEVEGLISNYHRLIDGYIAGEPLTKLSKGMHCLAGGFTGPILDLESGLPREMGGSQDELRFSASVVGA